jgi:hypothetical protein
MRKVLLLTVAVVCLPVMALSQDVGSIDIFSDAGLTSCNITVPVGPFPVYIAQTNVVDGTIAVQFRVEAPATFTNVGDIPSFPLALGNTTDGISISFGACKSGTFLLVTTNYVAAATAACELMTIMPPTNSPSTDKVKFQTCADQQVLKDQAGQARVNPDATCMCNVPVEETTWGGIKALYK